MPNGDYTHEYIQDAEWSRAELERHKTLLALACMQMELKEVELPGLVQEWWDHISDTEKAALFAKAMNE